MDNNNPCLFCNIGHERLYENEYFFSIFDAVPVSPGHALMIPKRHLVSFLELSDVEQSYFFDALENTVTSIQSKMFDEVYRGLAKGVKTKEYVWDSNKLNERSFEYGKRMLKHPHLNSYPEDVNIGVNDGIAAGRTIHHLHVQIIPRYDGDVDNPRGGIRNILSYGNYTLKK